MHNRQAMPEDSNKLGKVVRRLTFDHWVGAPIPSRRKPDGVRSNVGSRVRFLDDTLGYIWTEWFEDNGEQREVICRMVAGDSVVTRSLVDTAAVAYALAAEWAERNQRDFDVFETGIDNR